MALQAIGDQEVEQFRAHLHGELIRPGDAAYDETRAVWNGMIDKRPGLIARCRGTADVITAVNVARENDLQVAVRGGGHNVAGTAVCDDGLVIDLSEMAGVWVDPEERTAWVQGGATWADVDHETQAFGLATPGGVVSKTGVAGLTLGGGIGHLRCKYGLTCDNLVSVDVVTAAGEFLTASEDENQALFWGLRGGGGNFGIVTGFAFDLHPVGPEVATCFVIYPGERLAECLRAYREYIASAPEEVSTLSSAGVMRDEDVTPRAISLQGARSMMRRRCDAAGIDVDGEYLKPHGARRGLGHQLYTEGRAELAQEVLRHTDISVTHEAYKESRVMETKLEVESILEADE
jgi:FAD/FMN-containing dehydrogenase